MFGSPAPISSFVSGVSPLVNSSGVNGKQLMSSSPSRTTPYPNIAEADTSASSAASTGVRNGSSSSLCILVAGGLDHSFSDLGLGRLFRHGHAVSFIRLGLTLRQEDTLPLTV